MLSEEYYFCRLAWSRISLDEFLGGWRAVSGMFPAVSLLSSPRA